MTLSAAQQHHFDLFGFVRLRGVIADVIEQVRVDFDATVRREQLGVMACEQFMDGTPSGSETQERMLVAEPLGDDGPMRWLRDHPSLLAVPRSLLGPGWGYAFSFANLYNCNVHWHDDGIFAAGGGAFVNVAVYLDPLRGDTGALRVVPGSHRPGPFRDALRDALMLSTLPVTEAFGVAADQIPAQILDVVPGDVIVTHPKVVHGSFHGGIGRRLLTVVFGAEPDRSSAFVRPIVAAARPATACEVSRSLGPDSAGDRRPERVAVGADRSAASPELARPR